jgi:site-specific recombinase XerD
MLAGSDLNHELVERYKLWLASLGYSVPVQCRYPRIVRAFCDRLENKEVTQTTPWDIRTFLLHESRRGLEYDTVREALIPLRSFFEFLGLGGITQDMPVKSVRMKAAPRDPPRVVSPETISRLVAAAQNSRDIALVELLYATGCRAKELINIRVGDIDFDSRKIRVVGKNSKARYVVFGLPAANAVKDYLCGRKHGYLFQSAWLQRGTIYKCSRTERWVGEVTVFSRSDPLARRRIVMRLGWKSQMSLGEAWTQFRQRTRRLNITRPAKRGPMTTSTVRRILYSLALRAGIKRITPHTVRHCFATHMLDGGADIREIQELMGHVCLTSTQIYTHVSRKKLLETFDRCHPRGSGKNVQVDSKAT